MNLLAKEKLSTLRLITDPAYFATLKDDVKADVLLKVQIIHPIHEAGHRQKGAMKEAAALALDCSVTTINRYLGDYRAQGFKGLVSGHINGGTKGLPVLFRDFVATLFLQNQRALAGREVQRQLVERWNRWRRTGNAAYTIPGYDFPPADCGSGHPAGWSVDNINRLRPDDYALAIARQGEKAAAKFLPSILKTRVGTSFGQIVFLDDQDYDNKVVAPGKSGKTLRPQGFNALDYHSGCFMEHCFRLRWRDESKDEWKTLSGVDYTWFQITYLQRHGYREDTGTMLVQEHGTAKGFDNKKLWTPQGHHSLAAALEGLSQGKIQTMASGLYNQPVFAGMLFRPQSSGNPNIKAPLESMFNLTRNRFASLPGAVGRNRDVKPAEQYGEDKYAEQMLKLYDSLDEQHRLMVGFSNLTFLQFGQVAHAIYDAINARRDHALQGWGKLGYTVPFFRWDKSSPWLSQQQVASLSPRQRAAAEALMEDAGHVMLANLAPAEVAAMHRRELTPIPDEWIPLLIPVQWSREATVTSKREIRIEDSLLGDEPFIYLARFVGSDSVRTLKAGTKVRCYLNPYDTSKLYVCRADGSWLGVLYERTRAGFLDHEQIMAQLHERAEITADLNLGVRPHLEGTIQRRTEMKRVNDRLAEGKAVLPEEIAEARSEAGRKGQRTAAANRLQARGAGLADWDSETIHDAAPDFDAENDPYAGLPDDADLE